ncbi:MAG: hypothetical protein M3069_14640 [Chloroflexota bacterium]|nr:hypothetical protein [Chloroflexota bacterium]
MTGLFALTVLCAGFAVLRLLGLAKGSVALGLAPAAGLAALTIVSSWGVLLGAPRPGTSAVVYGTALLGIFLAVRDRSWLTRSVVAFVHEHRVAVAGLVAASVIPAIALGFAFAGAQVPLSPHDGASHTEAIQAFRTGRPWLAWYPPGTAALFGTWLQAFPWMDSAQGGFELGLSLPPLAALSVFGLGMSVWRDVRFAAASAVLLSFTYLYPYFPQLWSGWPLALSLILVMGMWTVALEYLARPSARWGILGGVVGGSIVLIHGSELYTLALVLPVVLIAALRRVVWGGLAWSLLLALGLSVATAGPYLPSLIGWVGGGGAYEAGLAGGPAPQSTVAVDNAQPGLFLAFALNAFGIDLPIRVMLLVIGVAWSMRQRTGLTVVAVGLVFGSVAVVLNAFSDVPLARQVYAVTFPWGMHYRLLMLVTIAQALLAGAGGVVLLQAVNRRTRQASAWSRRLRRLSRVLAVTWLGLTTVALAVFMANPARKVLGYTADDAAAMDWLRMHASPGEVLLNDGYADAGIWVPYKAGMPIVLPRTLFLPAADIARRKLVSQNVGRLDEVPEAAAAACAEHVGYVYSGAKSSAWDERGFPPLDVLRASPALEEVFSQGSAAIFRTRLGCQ